MPDAVLISPPAPRHARRHHFSAGPLRGNLQFASCGTLTARRPALQENLATERPESDGRSQQDIAEAAIEACAQALEAWADVSQRADLMHNAAATLRRVSGTLAAEAIHPAD